VKSVLGLSWEEEVEVGVALRVVVRIYTETLVGLVLMREPGGNGISAAGKIIPRRLGATLMRL